MGATIAIITLSILVISLVWKLLPTAIELGELRQERKFHIVPEIKNLQRENDRLIADIERIINQDNGTINEWKDIIERRKWSTKLFESFDKQ